MNHKIVIYGAGYVGFSLAVLLAEKNQVILIEKDIDKLANLLLYI